MGSGHSKSNTDVKDVKKNVEHHLSKEKQKEHVSDVEQKEVKLSEKEKHIEEIQKEHVQDLEEKEVKPLTKEKPVKYENLVWKWDERFDPFVKGNPQWTPYDDITSTMIDTHY